MENQDHPSVVIMKELSDIKTNLAVNTNETQNIKASLFKVETSVNQIQADFVSRREFNDRTDSINSDVSLLKKIVYGCVTSILLSFIGAVMTFVIK